MFNPDFHRVGAPRSPCAPDCPRRSAGCHAGCPDWSEYEKKRNAQYSKFPQQYMGAETAGSQASREKNLKIKATRKNKFMLRSHK